MTLSIPSTVHDEALYGFN